MFFRKLLPALLWALFILVLCGVPGTQVPRLTFLEWLKPDKIIHLLIFGVQAWLLLKAFHAGSSPAIFRKHSMLWALVISIGYGVLVEVMQTYVFVDRYGDVRDALANAIGALIGAYLFRRHKKTIVDH